MKKFLFPIAAFLLLLAACRKDGSNTSVDTDDFPVPTEFVNGSVYGVVIDESFTPIANAVVQVTTKDGKKDVQTDKNGAFFLPQSTLNAKGTYLKVTASGYFHSSRTINLRPNSRNHVTVQLLTNQSTKQIDATTGGKADYGDYSIELPANAVEKADGSAYNGQIRVAARHLSPADNGFGIQAPGRLEGLTTQGDVTGLISMGQMVVELRDNNGDLLQIKDGSEATLRIKVPTASKSMAPATIPMWWFDEDKGIWREEGASTLQGDYYEGKVKHFTFWNWDFRNPTIEIDFKFVDENGHPVTDVMLDLQATVQHTHASGSPDADGHLIGKVPANEPLIAHVYIRDQSSNCTYEEILVRDLGSFSAPDTVCFTIPQSTAQSYEVKGTLLDCNGQPVSNGYARSALNHGIFPTDANGNFTIPLSPCAVQGFTSFDLYGIDIDNLKESAPVTVQLNAPVITVPPITVCTVLADHFTLVNDGITYQYIDALCYPMDSTSQGQTTSRYEINSGEFTTTGLNRIVNIGLSLTAAQTGTYTPVYASVTEFGGGAIMGYSCKDITDCNNFSVTITSWGGPGGYAEGTYTGTLPQFGPTAPTFGNTFSGSFKVKIF